CIHKEGINSIKTLPSFEEKHYFGCLEIDFLDSLNVFVKFDITFLILGKFFVSSKISFRSSRLSCQTFRSSNDLIFLFDTFYSLLTTHLQKCFSFVRYTVPRNRAISSASWLVITTLYTPIRFPMLSSSVLAVSLSPGMTFFIYEILFSKASAIRP